MLPEHSDLHAAHYRRHNFEGMGGGLCVPCSVREYGIRPPDFAQKILEGIIRLGRTGVRYEV